MSFYTFFTFCKGTSMGKVFFYSCFCFLKLTKLHGKPLLFVPVDFIRPALCVASFPGPFAATDLFFEHLYHKTASQHQSHRRLAHLCYCSQTRAPAPPQEADTKLGPAASSWRPGAQHCGAATHCCVAGRVFLAISGLYVSTGVPGCRPPL